MSNKYKHGDTVPTDVLCNRIDELVEVITHRHSRSVSMENEFTMRIPAELDRDADLVMDEVARRLRKTEQENKELKAYIKAAAETGDAILQGMGIER